MTSVLLLIVPGSDPVADAGHQKDQRDQEDQTIHEWRIADDRPIDRVTQRRARWKGHHGDHNERAKHHVERVAQTTRFSFGIHDNRLRRATFTLGAIDIRGGKGAEPWFNNAFGDDRHQYRHQNRRNDAEIQVRGDRDRFAGLGDLDSLVGHLG